MEFYKRRCNAGYLLSHSSSKLQSSHQDELIKLKQKMDIDKKKILDLEADKQKNVEATKTLSDILSSYKKQQ